MTVVYFKKGKIGFGGAHIACQLGARRLGMVVDLLLGQQDIVIEPFEGPRGMPAYVGGATILADGAPALILDAAALV